MSYKCGTISHSGWDTQSQAYADKWIKADYFLNMCITRQVNMLTGQSDNYKLCLNDTYLDNMETIKMNDIDIRAIPLTMLLDSGTSINIVN